jgi:hypothetical protein
LWRALSLRTAPPQQPRLAHQPILARLIAHAPAPSLEQRRERSKRGDVAEPNRHEHKFDRDAVAVAASDDQRGIFVNVRWHAQLDAAGLDLARIRNRVRDIDLLAWAPDAGVLDDVARR